MSCQWFRWQLFIYQVVMFQWTWQSCSRCEGQKQSHILIKDQIAKNKTPPAGSTLRDSRRCEKALRCTPSNYHAYTPGLLLCINVSWTGLQLRMPLVVRNVPQCTWRVSWSQDWQQEVHNATEETSCWEHIERNYDRVCVCVCVCESVLIQQTVMIVVRMMA